MTDVPTTSNLICARFALDVPIHLKTLRLSRAGTLETAASGVNHPQFDTYTILQISYATSAGADPCSKQNDARWHAVGSARGFSYAKSWPPHGGRSLGGRGGSGSSGPPAPGGAWFSVPASSAIG